MRRSKRENIDGPAGVNENRRDEQLEKEFLDFEITSTHATFFEAGKVVGTALLTYLLLVCLSLLLVFGNVKPNQEGGSSGIRVPFLELTVDKPYAAWITLLLGDMSLYWFFSALANELLLGVKLYDLLDKRYKTDWYTNLHLRYPSVFSATFLIILYSPMRLSRIFNYFDYVPSDECRRVEGAFFLSSRLVTLRSDTFDPPIKLVAQLLQVSDGLLEDVSQYVNINEL